MVLVLQANNELLYGQKFNTKKGSNPMLEKATGWIRSLTEAGLALIALGVVLQILFGDCWLVH